MQFTNTIISAIFATAVIAAPTTPSLKTRQVVDPLHPTLSTVQQCRYTGGVGRNTYNVIINNAKDFTKDECGSGFLDNLHGQGCTVTGWGCNYAEDGTTMNANFSTDLGCVAESVGTAIWSAFGHLSGVTCETSDTPIMFPPRRV